MFVDTDPLGMYPVFYYLDEDALFVSNNVYFIAESLRACGKPVKKDPALFGFYTTLGTGVSGRTGYCGVRLLGAGERLCVAPDNSFSLQRRPLSELLYSERRYDVLVDEAAEEILGNIRALASGTFPELASDLSGGMDSRLVLSAILHEQLQDAFLFFSVNQYPNADANTAALIRKRFGLRRGCRLHPSSADDYSDFGRMRRGIGRLGGLMETYTPVAISDRHADCGAMVLGGGLGELMREFWGGRSVSANIRNPLGPQLHFMRRNSSRLLTDSAAQEQRDEVLDLSNRLLADDVRPQHVSDAFYILTRNAYHFGVNWKASRRRFHPLYSPAAIKAAHALPDEQRRANRLGFDLMVRFCKDLAMLPFAEKSWSPLVLPDAPSPITKLTRRLGIPREPRTALYPADPGHPKSEVDPVEAEMRSRGVKSSCIRSMRLVHGFRKLSPAPSLEPLADVFDLTKVRAFMDQEPAILAVHPNFAANQRLLAACVWVNDLETGIRDPAS